MSSFRHFYSAVLLGLSAFSIQAFVQAQSHATEFSDSQTLIDTLKNKPSDALSWRSPSNETATVTVFGASWCGPCKTLKEQLEGRGIPYDYIDIDKEPDLYKKAKEQSKTNAIPLTGVTKQNATAWVVGADIETIEKLYRD